MIKFSDRVCVQRFLSSRIDYQTNFVIGLLHYMCTDALCTYVYVYGPHVMPIFCPGELSPARLLDLTKKGCATRFLIAAHVTQHLIPGAICRVAWIPNLTWKWVVPGQLDQPSVTPNYRGRENDPKWHRYGPKTGKTSQTLPRSPLSVSHVSLQVSHRSIIFECPSIRQSMPNRPQKRGRRCHAAGAFDKKSKNLENQANDLEAYVNAFP